MRMFRWIAGVCLMTILVLFTLMVARPRGADTPTISYHPYAKVFRIDFPGGGYAYACTEFKSLVETIEEDGKQVLYTPRKCGPLQAGVEQDAYEDDWSFIVPNGGKWEVRAVLQKEDATEYPTNVLTLVH